MSRLAHRFGALGLAALASAAGLGPRAESRPDPVGARAFEVRYRPLSDAADVVGDVLSPDGTVTLRPALKTLVVEDRVSVLDRVEALLQSFDLPPRNVEVVVGLFLATQRRDRAEGPPPRRGKLLDLPPLDFMKWNAYESLGSRSVVGVEGDQVISDLSSDYRVVFVIDSVDPNHGKVRFKSFSLQRRTRGEQGQEQIENQYTMGMVVDIGKQQVVGAATRPDAERALFLTLQVKSR